MSSRSTISPSFEQMYCCLSRDPHFLCRWLNEIPDDELDAVKSFTGIETSPNDTVTEPIERSAMGARLPSVGDTGQMPAKLEEYRRKRTPGSTPEPFGGVEERGQLF